jgi:dTDP-4-dehydrorhamnose reductase
VTTEAYGAGKQLAPRPEHSSLDLAKLRATGFVPEDASVALRRYLGG